MKAVGKHWEASGKSFAQTRATNHALIGGLLGAGLCVPTILAVSQLMPLNLLEVLGAFAGCATIGSGISLLASSRKMLKASAQQPKPVDTPTFDEAPMRPVSELVMRHDGNGDVLAHSGTSHAELKPLGDAIFGKGLLNLIRISDRPAYLKAISDAVHKRVPRTVNLHIAVSQNPEIFRPFAFTTAPSLVGCESSLRDIAKEIALEKALESAGAGHANEQDIITAASHVAHELRSPLNSILGFSELLADDNVCRFSEVQRKEYAELIHQSGSHLLRVVDNMLDIGSLKAGRLELSPNTFDVGLLCHECVSILAPQIGQSDVNVTIDCSPDMEPLYADENCCRQMLLNLLGNAVKFTSGAGDITLTARKVNGHVEFEVKDTGIGIPDEALERLGQPFERVEGTQVRGTGLGLALVRQMTSLHGGTFKLQSVLGEGTIATLSLPAVRAAVTNLHSDMPAKEDGTTQPGHIAGHRRTA